MTPRSAPIERHGRVVATLWFCAFAVLIRLFIGLVFEWLAMDYAATIRIPSTTFVSYSCLLLAAGGAAVWLGSPLLEPGVAPADVVRRGGWIGLVTGAAYALSSSIALRAGWRDEAGAPFAWSTAPWVVLQSCFMAGILLPIGVLAAVCLVRLAQGIRGSTP